MSTFRPTSIDGVFTFDPLIHGDSRGSFHEWYRLDAFAEATGYPFFPEQANMSVSAAGVVRGLHFADVNLDGAPGQAKIVTCPAGHILDIAVDLRRGSETFGRVEVFELDSTTRRVVYLPNGIGHGFVSLADGSVLTYLTSTAYNPEAERAVSVQDPEIGIDLGELLSRGGLGFGDMVLSERDQAAPTIAEFEAGGLALPTWEDCRALDNAARDEWALANEEAGQ
nr:dTDP-4-dehydrorhamnose 3,5-epimerase family protein [Corynebacterium lactis]